MLFPTATFAIFFLIVLPLSWLAMPKVHRWRPFILVASYVFYSWWDWRFIFLLAGCTIWNQLLAVRIHRASTQAQRKALLTWRWSATSACSRYFKYYDFFVDSSTEHGGDRRAWSCPLSLKHDHPAGRHLVLHVHGDQLRRRHLPRRLRADDAREVRRLPLVLPAPRGRADRPAGRADPAARRAARPATRRHEPRLLPDRDGPVQEGGDRELPRLAHRRPGLRRAGAALVARDPDRDLRLRGPDLRRLLRLHRHRDRPRAPARVQVPAELRLARTPPCRSRTSGAAGT